MKPEKVYACYNKDKEARLSSSSGAVFTSLADYVLNKDGIVYGLYVPDLQNEGYPEDIYVSRCGAQMYQLCGAWSASDGRECVKELQAS